MIDSAVLGAVVDECAAWPTELVVQRDGCCEAEQALKDALPEAGECSGAVALEGKGVLAGPEDALDALAYWREVRTATGSSLRWGLRIVAFRASTSLANCAPA
jgi:hypothetical protein